VYSMCIAAVHTGASILTYPMKLLWGHIANGDSTCCLNWACMHMLAINCVQLCLSMANVSGCIYTGKAAGLLALYDADAIGLLQIVAARCVRVRATVCQQGRQHHTMRLSPTRSAVL
jgi:hypothetical protein